VGTVVPHQNWRGIVCVADVRERDEPRPAERRPDEQSDELHDRALTGAVDERVARGREPWGAGVLAGKPGGRDARRERPDLHAQPLLRPVYGPVHADGSHRARGWAQRVRVCGWGSSFLLGSIWVVSIMPNGDPRCRHALNREPCSRSRRSRSWGHHPSCRQGVASV